jgi:hypothetical protein
MFLFWFFRTVVSNIDVQRLARIQKKWLFPYECCMTFLFRHEFSSFVLNQEQPYHSAQLGNGVTTTRG